MIRNFACTKTEKLFSRRRVKAFSAFEEPAREKLTLLDTATKLEDLKVPPGNRLEPLKGDRNGQHSIRINKQWRLCFAWDDGDAYDVEIVDYH